MDEVIMETSKCGNYSSCCRLCLMDSFNSLKPIFDDATENQGLVEKILSFLGLEVSVNDKLSTMICSKCMDKIENWYNFKITCYENQEKLTTWMKQWDSSTSDMQVQIKDELMEDEQLEQNTSHNHDLDMLIKPEPTSLMEEDMYESPPVLTPHHSDLVAFEDLSEDVDSTIISDIDTSSQIVSHATPENFHGRKCFVCNKLFSTPGNRRKHEKTIHKSRNLSNSMNVIGSISFDENSQASVVLSDNSVTQDEPLTDDLKKDESYDPDSQIRMTYSESDIQKIQFAAGLQLVQRNGTPNEISSLIGDSHLTKVEDSYITKCRKMVTMFSTLICSCHGYQHKTAKRLFAHLRSLCSWFPIYTCYNCLTTFTDRSSNMRHNGKCPRTHLENLIKLSELRKLNDFRIRLYQFFKCVKCNYVFGFHDDFCDHIDSDHSPSELPVSCICGTMFEDVELYKQHLYRNCMVNFYCDICFGISPTLHDFKKHCEEAHDQADGFQFLVNENSNMNITYEPDNSFDHFSQDEGETIECAPDLQLDGLMQEIEQEKVMNPHAIRNWYSKTACPLCGKVYSNYHNMLRHFKTHDESEKTIPCPHCDEKFRLKSELKEHLIIDHGVVENKIALKQNSYPCPECGIVFANYDEWFRHKKTHDLPYSCSECGKQLNSQEELDQHRSVHLNIKVFRDSKTDSYRSAMLSPGSMEACDVDSPEMIKDIKMQVVKEKRVSGKIYSCETCNKVYSGYGGLWEHNKRYHPERRGSYPRKCKYCDKMVASASGYVMHKQMHERYSKTTPIKQEPDNDDEESYHTCKKCFKVFSGKSNLRSHMKCHGISLGMNRIPLKSGRTKTYWCDICHQACHGFEELQKHKEEHVNENMSETPNSMELAEDSMQEFCCDICNLLFTTKFALKKHKENHLLEDNEEEAADKKNFVYCKYCKIPFLNSHALSMHMDTEHVEIKQKNKKTKHPCNLCDKVFDTSGALCSHQGWHKRVNYDHKTYKTKSKPASPMPTTSKFECHTCSEKYVNDTALQIHILEVHRNINATLINPRCNMCEIDLESQSAYENHMELHKIVEKQNEQKTYSCKFCTSSFSRSDVLNAHIRTHHSELLGSGFKCTQCDRVFDKQTSLHIHMKVHDRHRNNSSPPKTGKFLYSCSICHLGFNIPKELRNHIIAAHPF